jgi:hypothetical protein
MLTITILQGLTFILYVTFIVYKFGVLPSISDSWYQLDGLQKSLFTWFCWSLGGLMAYQTNGDTGLFVLSGGGLLFVGAATMFKTDEAKSNLVHPLGAFLCISGALVGLLIERHTFIPLILFVFSSGVISLLVKTNKIWWVEISAFVAILLGLLFF